MRRTGILRLSTVLAVVVLTVTVGSATASAEWAFVTNDDDTGPGSFRNAIDSASVAGSPITHVQFLRRVTIELFQTVLYSGSQDLSIGGLGSTLDGANIESGPAFLATGGGDIVISSLKVRRAPAEGITVEVPTGTSGTVRVSLVDVDIVENAGHGVLVDDQANNTGATVNVKVVGTRFIGNGFIALDRDGLRVNEGGDGDLVITILHSQASENGADGIEADERGRGDVRVDMLSSHVGRNGWFSDEDFDDGFDIDEADDGSVLGNVRFSTANDNYEQGFDFNENGPGDLRVDMRHVEASGNAGEGIDYEEDDAVEGGGDLVTTMVHVKANGNLGGDGGVKIRERGEGLLDATLERVEASQNLARGIQIQEGSAGNLKATIKRATTLGNAPGPEENEGSGIGFEEGGAGELNATVSNSNSSTNAGYGVLADEGGDGGSLSSLTLTAMTLNGNTLGPFSADVTVVGP